MRRRHSGFTLIEVLIALAITVFVSTIAYSSLSAVISGVEDTRRLAQRTHEINRAWMILSRDLRQFSPRPVSDEFGELEPAMLGGPAARFLLSFTRSGWHNPQGLRRANLQRVNYRLEDETLWRDSYPVLDRAGDSQPREVELLGGVEFLELKFLGTLEAVGSSAGTGGGNDRGLDTRNWPENWVNDGSRPGGELAPPVALEVTMQLTGVGEIRRLYALPTL